VKGGGGAGDDVERFFVQHLAPVAVVDSVGALRETLTSTCIPTVAGGELEARVAGERLQMGAVQVLDALTQSVSGHLIGSADETQSDDAGLVQGFCYRSLNLCWGGRCRRRIRRG